MIERGLATAGRMPLGLHQSRVQIISDIRLSPRGQLCTLPYVKAMIEREEYERKGWLETKR